MSRVEPAPAPHFFVVPDLAGPSSGGTLYNRALITALQATSFPAEALALDVAERALSASQRGVYWVDTLYLDHFERLRRSNTRRRPIGLLTHYWPALVTYGADLGVSQLSAAEAFALHHADAFVVTSAFMAATLQRLGVSERSVGVVEPGCWAAGVRTEVPRGGTMRALLVAQLVPGKGIEPLLQALAQAWARGGPEFELRIFGGTNADPEYAERCHALVASTPALSRAVHFEGELPVTEVVKRLATADLVLSASRMESYGMVLAEARTLGVPILALPGGNVAALVTEAAGGEIVVDVAALARRAVALGQRPDELRGRAERAVRNAPAPRPWSRVAAEFREWARASEPHFAGQLT
jgi:glycosyltransferase involved in cell wall biosynthesis